VERNGEGELQPRKQDGIEIHDAILKMPPGFAAGGSSGFAIGAALCRASPSSWRGC
jgi:hypothetical protein